jgi:acetyl esterase/lipase
MAWLFGAGAALLSVLGLVLVLSGCSPLAVLNVGLPKDSYRLTEDVVYGVDPRQRLDVYVPAGAVTGRPVVVFFYGGSWKSGRRQNYRFMGEALTSRGFVAVVADYRLYPDVRFPAFVGDGAAAVAWVRANIAGYGGNPRKVFLMGHSAGAHIAALLALDERYLAAVGESPKDLSGVIGVAGPYAFDPLQYRTIRPIFAGLTDPDQARPIAFADGAAPPMLLLHGEDDRTVYPANSLALAHRLKQAGNGATVIAYPDLGHIAILLAFARPFRSDDGVLADAARFIDGEHRQATTADQRQIGRPEPGRP